MLQAMPFCLAIALVHALAVQAPLASGQRWQDGLHPTTAIRADGDFAKWSLSKLPNPNATDHLVFETVHSLLQHWPNTRMRNGHNIVPGIIPIGTHLYHGRLDKELPTGPEWAAADPEHSYIFCRNRTNSSQKGGWHLTLMAIRPLKIIYFDGSSAIKFPNGPMDTQDLITWDRPSDSKNISEQETRRIRDLCDWGKNLSVDGFVRMEMDFEIMLCDFMSGLSVVSFEHLASQWSGPSMMSSSEFFEVLNAGAWHNRFPGETRFQLDLPGLVSFYDTELAPSLVPIRAGQERWDHRAINISSENMSAVKSRLAANLMRPSCASSGIDWQTLLQVVVDRYADRLEVTRYLLNLPVADPDDILDLAKKAQTQLRIMLTPYLLFSAAPTSPTDNDWTIPIYKLCATTHTHSMEPRFGSMTDSEKLILQAVRGTSREICRVVTKMWAAGVYAGIDPSLNTMVSPNIAEVTRLRGTWAEELQRLMAWLDWSTWVKCNPECGIEERCYLPTWPVGFPWVANEPLPLFPIDDDDTVSHRGLTSLASGPMGMEDLADDVRNTIKPEPDEWIRPRPKCVRRITPYTF